MAGEFVSKFCRNNLPDAKDIRNIIRSARSNSKTYAIHKAKYLLRTYPRNRGYFETNLASMPEPLRLEYSGLYQTKARILESIEAGMLVEAAEIIEACSDVVLKKLSLFDLWHSFRKSNETDMELIIARFLRKIYPNDMFKQLHAVNTYTRAGFLDRASIELDRIIGQFGMTRHSDHLRKFAQALKRSDILMRLDKFAQCEP